MRVKELALRAARAAGLPETIGRSDWRTRRLAILCYHGISLGDEHCATPELYMRRTVFRSRLEHLRDGGYNVISLTEGIDRLTAGSLAPKSVVLTFDDGATDFSQVAVPILNEFRYPATVYLTTYYCEHRLPVFDTALRYLLWRGRDSGADVARIIGAPSPLLVSDAESRRLAAHAIHRFADERELSALEKNQLLERTATEIGVDFVKFVATGMFSIMTPEQVVNLPRDLVDIQLHTHRHRTPREYGAFCREIIDNKKSLKRLVDSSDLVHFCYPCGDYWKDFLSWLPGLGVRTATTCVPALATQESDPLLLPRFVDTSSITKLVFDSWLSGVADLLPRKRRHRLDYAVRLRGR